MGSNNSIVLPARHWPCCKELLPKNPIFFIFVLESSSILIACLGFVLVTRAVAMADLPLAQASLPNGR